jgi:hypothetical protein
MTTRCISFRSDDVGGAIAPAAIFDADIDATITYRPIPMAQAAAEAAGKDLILAIHGFNVSRKDGVRAFTALKDRLAIADTEYFLGVLWPGDFWIPAVNYPWEAHDAVKCGARLANVLNNEFAAAATISLLSHSLGARVLLETIRHLSTPAREICVAAGAVDWDCLERQYDGVLANVHRLSVLASAKDKVLRVAYPAGDFLSDLFGDNDSPFARALGLKGPHKRLSPPNLHRQIPNGDEYGHSDYFPPGNGDPPDDTTKWPRSVAYAAAALRGGSPPW